jgi:hypothetical protein
VGRILKQHGKGFRKHANVLIFLAPDVQRASEVTDTARRLLALRSIDEHKPTKSQLTEDQLKDLAGRLKEAEARLPAALMTAYRHILLPDKNKAIRSIERGMGVGKGTLSQKVLDKLKDEQQILDKLDPAILIGERVRPLAAGSRSSQRQHSRRLFHPTDALADVARHRRSP